MTAWADGFKNPGRIQARWLLVFFSIALGTCLLTDLAARNRTLERWITAESSELSDKNGKLFSNNGSFIDYEERILLDELPNTDFSHGGVYFFGSSNMKWAFTTWDLPDSLRQRLRNYGTGAATHRTIQRLIRYVGDRGIFAGGGKNEIIIGVSYHLGTTEMPGSYFPALVRRQGIYTISSDDRLVEVPMSPAERWLRIEKARSGGFAWNLGRLASNWVLARSGLHHRPPQDPEFNRRAWREFMGPDWQRNIDRELERLRQTLVSLHEAHVSVKIIMLPQGTWMQNLPFASYYDRRVRTIAKLTFTPLLNWSKILPDDNFIDSNHLTNAGQTKFRSMILKEEAGHLHRLEQISI